MDRIINYNQSLNKLHFPRFMNFNVMDSYRTSPYSMSNLKLLVYIP